MASLDFILKRRRLTLEKWLSIKSIVDSVSLVAAIKLIGADPLSDERLASVLASVKKIETPAISDDVPVQKKAFRRKRVEIHEPEDVAVFEKDHDPLKE